MAAIWRFLDTYLQRRSSGGFRHEVLASAWRAQAARGGPIGLLAVNHDR